MSGALGQGGLGGCKSRTGDPVSGLADTRYVTSPNGKVGRETRRS